MATKVEDAYAADAAQGAGMPQLELMTFPNQVFWLVVALIVIYLVLSRVALPRIGSVIEERHDAIANDIEMAAEYKRKAEEAESNYETALSEARAEAHKIAADAKAAVQKDVDAAIAAADAEIAKEAEQSATRIAEIQEGAVAAISAVANETALAVIQTIDPDLADQDAVGAAVAAEMG